MSGLIDAAVVDGVGRLRLTRAGKRNALSHGLVDEAEAAVDRFTAAGVSVAVLAADPPVFCAGNDLVEARADRDNPAADRFFELLVGSPLLWIAAVSGPALGAGVAAVACCPIAVATPDAQFILPERGIGLFPTAVLKYLEPSMGPRAAFAFGFSGRPLGAEEARASGLVNEVVAAEQLDAAVERWVELAVERPTITDAARSSWQGALQLMLASERARQSDRILAAQSFDTEESS
jgi:enoyl-CoA hydratase/carnithine racemase